jgi:hypothetical protein
MKANHSATPTGYMFKGVIFLVLVCIMLSFVTLAVTQNLGPKKAIKQVNKETLIRTGWNIFWNSGVINTFMPRNIED